MMGERVKPKYFWFRLSIALGLGLGLLLLVQTVVTYRHVNDQMLHQEAQREADRRMQSIDRAARLTRSHDPATLTSVLHELVHEAPGELAWIRIINAQGKVIAETERVSGARAYSADDFGGHDHNGRDFGRMMDEGGGHRPDQRATQFGPVLVWLNPLRLPPAPAEIREPRGRPTPTFVEIAIYLNGVSANFGPLRTYLIVSCSAAFALMGAVILIGIRFPNYMRGKRVDEELALARRVQLDLFPTPESLAVDLPFGAKCVPAWQVGGDLYDVFETDDGEVALILGDVSGKGLPAALLMGVVQGAVRASSGSGAAASHEQAAERLNQLLCMKTARERFVSLFWCYFDPQVSTLRYINAGHLPPLLIRNDGSSAQVVRLDEGGPVLGLLPGASYTQASVQVRSGDLLVVYSDGILEAENARGDEFGEAGIIAAIERHPNRTPGEICAAVLEEVRVFLGSGLPQDDQTLLIARLDRVGGSVTEAPLIHSRAVQG
jgi:Stage II sporulation protein E (SpoIIE)